ncbi:MAG TPA: hypothetical protein DEO32_06260 [Ruminococcaceae bacterium]|nr:hypothetical protein [Oscillospiraceae bacterium]
MISVTVPEKLHTVSFPYPKLPPRRVRIYVPEHEEGETMPVIYMTDGQNLFYEDESVWGCWKVIETVVEEARNGLGKVIIVGIDNGGVHRDNELTPASIGEVICPNEMENFTEPLGEEFDFFVTQTVMPHVEAHFPVKKGKKYTAFCGSSSGGLQSFFTGLEHPDLFGALGVFSPAFLLYSAQSWANWIKSKMTADMPYLYIYTGSGDDLEQRIYFSTELVYDLLTALDYPYEKLNEVVMFEYGHNEEAWEEIFRDFVHTFLSRAE